jgi:23S rRNA (adenine2503-C2)-methyltransferase
MQVLLNRRWDGKNLTTSEILNQILAVKKPGGKIDYEHRSDENDEPHGNYQNTRGPMMLHPDAFKFSSRRVTLSTVGLLPEMEKMAKERIRFRLAISLNATDEETRSHLMPVNRRYPFKKVLELCRKFPLQPRSRITFEYVMVKDINDSSRDAKRLLKMLRGIPSKVNLIPLNEAPGISFKRPSDETVREFQEILMEGGLTAIVRASKGAEIQLPASSGKRQGIK